MTRIILLTVLNIMLPFLIRAAYLYFLIYLAKRQQKKAEKEGRIIDITPPTWHFPVVKLLLIGIVLLAASLLIYRLASPIDKTWDTGNKALSEDF